MQKTIDLIKVILLLCYIVFSGCAFPMRSGYYTVKEVRGLNTIVLKEVQGDWHIPNSDSLKVGQRIYLNRTKKTELVNVW